ncbi:hypothetical protein C8F01DRAFT_1228867 [Mycena amicta]|nr:hypothetical protein C8F01DRAFT_1228867 [Mycena amicta]
MASLTDLSVELVQDIAAYLETADHASLRSVCRHIGLTMDACFFETLILPSNRLNESMLEAIASARSRSPWANNTRELVIAPGRKLLKSVAELPVEDEDALKTSMASALACLTKVSVVRFKIMKEDPSWLNGVVFDACQHFPLRTFELVVDSRELAILPPFPTNTLEVLTVIAPVWYRPLPPLIGMPIQPDAEGPAPPPLAYQIASIVAENRGLRALHITDGKDWDDVWNALLQSNIYLTELQTGEVSTTLLSYLGAYSGLERLSLIGHDANRQEANDLLADLFYAKVLQRHRRTLREFRCRPSFEGRWSFAGHNVKVVTGMEELKVLEMSLNSVDVTSTEAAENAVPLFFQTALALPKLSHFAILPTMGEFARGARCGGPSAAYREGMLELVERAVGAFLPLPDFADSIREDEDGYKDHGGGQRWDYEVGSGPKHLRSPAKHFFDMESDEWRAYRRAFWAGEVVKR